MEKIKITIEMNISSPPQMCCPICGSTVDIVLMDVFKKFGSVYAYCHECKTEMRLYRD